MQMFDEANWLLLYSLASLTILKVSGESYDGTCYLRNFFGKCLEYNANRQVFVFTTICREKFQWSSGAMIVHIPTAKCLSVNSTADGSFLALANRCSEASNLFQYDEYNHTIIHLISGKCLHPERRDSPSSNEAVIIKSNCSLNTNKYWFRPTAHYIIRHSSGLCWSYNDASMQIELQKTQCDRFEYENDYRLKHVNSGKCVWETDSHHLNLTVDCKSVTTEYKLNEFNNIKTSADRCIHLLNNQENPLNEPLVSNSSCSDANHLQFHFYDERDILEVKLMSESCDDIPNTVCQRTRGHITVNGFQYSLNKRGVNVVLYDYRSGLYEHRSTYDVHGSTTENANLQQFLNGLKGGKLLLMSVRDAVTFDENAATALQLFGVSATFANAASSMPRRSMASITYTGQERKAWEISVNKDGGKGPSAVQQNIMLFRELSGRDDCSQELGAQNWEIPNTAFTAQSNMGSDYQPFYGRLQKHSNGWCSGRGTSVSEYIQVDIGTMKAVTGVAIQGEGGANDGDNYVTKFKLQYSIDNHDWNYYVETGASAKIFDGLQRKERMETKVNWFRRTMARYLRIVPTERSTSDLSCLRLEFYGCAPKTTVFSVDNLKQLQPFTPNKYHKSNLSVCSFVREPSTLKFGISNAAENQSFADNIQQIHIGGLEVSPLLSYGKMVDGRGAHEKLRNQSTHFISSQFYNIDVSKPSYVLLDMIMKFRVLDALEPSGSGWGVLSVEKKDQVSILCYPQHFMRKSPDKSSLSLTVSQFGQREIVDEEMVQVNVSLSHIEYKSYANAYNIDIFIYYDQTYLDLKALRMKNTYIGGVFIVLPSRNITSPGMIHIKTDELRLLTSHFATIEFKLAIPKAIGKGEKCSGALLVEFTYRDNLKRFNGAVQNTVKKFIPYKCKIKSAKDISLQPIRLNVPQFSMVYDNVNEEFFFCIQRTKYARRNAPFCYRQKKDSSVWHGINYFASLKGIDVTKRELYGIGRLGAAYFWSYHPFHEGFQMEDSRWAKAESNSNMRKSVVANELSSLSLDPAQGMIISTDRQELWAATRVGIWKKSGSQWKRAIMF